MSPSVDVEYGAQMEREAQRYKAQRDEAIRRAEQRIAELEQENERLREWRMNVTCAAMPPDSGGLHYDDVYKRVQALRVAEQLCEQLVEAKNLIEQRKVKAEQQLAEARAVIRLLQQADGRCQVCAATMWGTHTSDCRLAAILKEE